ncbi:hypothetical protein [Cryobacterium gelidum]|uniref:Uncharacterized protein n=1 Tax=Cryobacterium gelidum TaxID=1259164 RepID=A0A4R9AY47_9MICO|nr:hypothetical protein [Cryobacterium gelidum]TFD72736.1 hypothetical protein E3T50_05330 [Cryobacterium gelidum]
MARAGIVLPDVYAAFLGGLKRRARDAQGHAQLAVLVGDAEMTVRHLTYDLHRDISAELLEEAIGLHQEDAPRIAFQIHAPLAALRLKPFNFASRDDIERYLAGTRTDTDRSRAFHLITKSSDNALLTLDELMTSLSL